MSGPESRPQFVREATGLVRALGFGDQLIISLSFINIVGGYVFTILSVPFFFPGADSITVLVLGAIPALLFVGMYSTLSAAMPRSGGDYVWTGRILGPRLATIMAILFLFSQSIAFLGLNAWGFNTLSLAQAFLALGLTTNNAGLISLATTITQPLNGFILSLIFLIGIILVGIFGVEVYKKVNRITFFIYVIILVLFLSSLVSVSQSAFQSSVDSALRSYNITYSSVLSATNQNPQLSSFSLFHTILAFPLLGFLTYSGFNFSTYAAGEMKNVSKTVPRSLIAAVLITVVFLFIQGILTYNTMGVNFVIGVSYLYNTGQLGALPVQPIATFLISLAINPWIGFIVNLSVAVGDFLVALQCLVMFTRIIFALSFDRVLPTKFAAVNERFHSPHIATVTVGVLSILTTSLYWYGPGLLTGYLNIAIAVDVAYMIPGLAAFLFPFVKKDLYNRTVKLLPGIMGKEIGGWPLISIFGLGVTLIWGFGIYTELFPVSAYGYLGSSLGFAAGATIAPIVASLLLFEVARAYNKKKGGIDITMSFREIPPE